MNPLIKNALAVLAGFFIGSLVNMSLVMLGPYLIPPPEGLDVTNFESLKSSIHLLKPQHYIFPFLAHALGTLAGAFMATRIAATNKLILALAVGAFFFLAGLFNAFQLPSPLWFIILDLGLAYFPMAWLGNRLAR